MSDYWHSSYGFLTKAIIPLARRLEPMLCIEWQQHDSEAWGDYYLYPPYPRENKSLAQETYKLYLNRQGLISWFEPRFKQCGVLLNVTTDHPFEIDMLLFSEMKDSVILFSRATLDSLLPPDLKHYR